MESWLLVSRSNGFTLMETLIVLFIFSILISLPLAFLPSQSKHQQSEHAARLFNEDLLFAQHLAMTEGMRIKVEIDHHNERYTLVSDSSRSYLSRAFPMEGMYFEEGTLGGNRPIEFLPNGHPRFAGSISLYAGDRQYRYTIMIGKGKVKYERL
ncbi:type II secretion system protein [Halalkalibacterium halodurans]|nr:type II secretion system protein [Halalkalibacterium halodurans]TPE65860.1 type II secretion system protein [Halalkalibacterium halodurans]